LIESDVSFVVADMPLANRFTLHLLAAVAEYESCTDFRADEGRIRCCSR
jgi:hypothetical protein